MSRSLKLRQQRQLRQLTLHENGKTRIRKPIDNIWGDYPDPSTTDFRLVYNNVNGICPGSRMSDLLDIGEAAERIKVDALCLVETNLDIRARNVIDKCTWTLRRFWTTSKMAMSSAITHVTKGAYQPGGTLTLVGQPWANYTTVRAETNNMGRWTEATLQGKEGNFVTILTAYRVCQASVATSGADTAYMQQWTMMSLAGNKSPDPRQQILDDMERRIEELRTLGHAIIVAIDANDTLQRRNAFTTWVQKLGLVDIVDYRHGSEDEPATHDRGSSRIDYVLVTPDLVEYVTAAGILPQKALCLSDHRPLFVDIDMRRFLRGEPCAAAVYEKRALQSNNPKAVSIYRKQLQAWLDQSGIEEDIQSINDDIGNGVLTPDQLSRKLDDIDNRFTAARLEAERQCQKGGKHPWSPQLSDARKKRRYWDLWVSELRTNTDYSSLREATGYTPEKEDNEETEDDATSEEDKEMDLETAIKFQRQAQAEHNAICRHAEVYRQEHLEYQAQDALDKGKPQKAAAIRQLIQAEQSRHIYARLRRVMGKYKNGGITHVLIPGERPDEWETVQDKEMIEDLLVTRNVKHFSQADGTPFTTAPLQDLLGSYGTSEFSEHILAGTAAIDNLDIGEAAKVLLKAMKRVDGVQPIDCQITADDVRQGYKVWRESTSTSPSGVHLGHEKALLREPDQIDHSGPSLSTRVFQIKAQLLNWAVEHGHVYQRWKTIFNFMLEKLPGKPIIHKLRVIHLIESDFNFLIGTLWGRRLMWQGEDLGVLGEEQCGSRKNRKAQDVLMFKQMVYSIMRMTRTGGGTFDNDAKSCYDRIVMVFASLTAQRIGMDKRVCELFLKTLEQVKYRIKTHLGLSEVGYSTTQDNNIHGPGQGGKASPAVWILECCLAMECMAHKTAGAWFTDPYKLRSVHRNMTGFVDDTTIWINNFLRELRGERDPSKILQQMKVTAQWWEELLFAMGGKLELEKCFYYLTSWKFDEEGIAQLQSLPQTPLTIVDSETQEEVFIRAQESTVSHKTLGVMESPQGDYKDERKRLREKAQAFARRMRTASLNREETTILYRSMFMPSMSYSLATGTLTEKEAHTIQSPAVQACLSTSGYSSTTPSALVFGSKDIGGLGFRHLFSEQGKLRTLSILQQLRLQGDLGETVFIALQWAQKVSGIGRPLLEDVTTAVPQLEEEKWLVVLRDFLQKSELGIRVVGLHLPDLAREHDAYIMDLIEKLGAAEIQCINRCRIYLQVELLSDICDTMGKQIKDTAMQCIREYGIEETDLWPVQPRPGPRHRRIWKQFLQRLSSSTGTLPQSLGRWQIRTTPRPSRAYYLPQLDCIVMHNNHGWERWRLMEGDRRGWEIEYHDTVEDDWRNMQAIPAEISSAKGRVTVRWGDYDAAPTTTIEPTIAAHPQAPAWEWDLLPFKMHIQPEQLQEQLEDGATKLYFVSDGSVVGDKGWYGWVLATDDDVLVEGRGPVRGGPITSYRAEAYGKLAWMVFLRRTIQKLQPIVRCAVVQYCDNKALQRSTKFDGRHNTARFTIAADFDVLQAIVTEQQELRRQVPRLREGRYVAGHQDRHEPDVTKLSRQAQLNIQADGIATMAQQEEYTPETNDKFQLPGCKAFLLDAGVRISSREASKLQWKKTEFELHRYYKDKFKWKSETIRKVNWAARRLALNASTAGQRMFADKLLIGWLATGKRLKMYGQEETQCHFCGEEEDNEHIFLCGCWEQHNGALLERLDKHFETTKTHGDIREGISEGLRKWLRRDKQAHSMTRCPIMQHCIAEQDEIGWGRMLSGLIGQEWCKHQEHRGDTGKLGDSWAAQLIRFFQIEAKQRWQERNEKVHAKSTGDGNTRTEREVWAQLRKLYDLALEVGHRAADIFAIPFEQRRTQPWRRVQAWISRMAPAIHHLVADHRRDSAANTRSMAETAPTTRSNPVSSRPITPDRRALLRRQTQDNTQHGCRTTTTTRAQQHPQTINTERQEKQGADEGTRAGTSRQRLHVSSRQTDGRKKGMDPGRRTPMVNDGNEDKTTSKATRQQDIRAYGMLSWIFKLGKTREANTQTQAHNLGRSSSTHSPGRQTK